MNEADALAFIVKQNLGFEYAEGRYIVRNVNSIGLIPPRRVAGEGTSLAAALTAYMGVLVDERGDHKVPLAVYVTEKDADPVVIAAVAADVKMPPKAEPEPKEEPGLDEPIEVVKGV